MFLQILQQPAAQSDNTVYYMTLGIVVILGFVYWRMWSAEKVKREFGVLFNESIEKFYTSVYVALGVLLALSEAAFAADIISTGGGEASYHMSSGVRFFGHFCLLMASIVGAVTFSRTLKSFVKIFRKDKFTIRLFAGHIFVMFFSALFAFVSPYVNMMLIANGLHQSVEVKLFLAELTGDTAGYIRILVKNGMDVQDYDAWGALSYPMASTVSITVSHLLVVLLELGFVLLHDAPAPQKKEEKKDTDKEKDDKKSEGEKPKDDDKSTGGAAKDSYQEAMAELMSFAGLGKDDISSRLETIRITMVGLTEAMRMTVSEKGSAIVHKVRQHNKATADGSRPKNELEKDRDAIDKEIRAFFQASPKKGDGLGMSLPAVGRKNT